MATFNTLCEDVHNLISITVIILLFTCMQKTELFVSKGSVLKQMLNKSRDSSLTQIWQVGPGSMKEKLCG